MPRRTLSYFVVVTTKLGDWRDRKVDLVLEMKLKATKQFLYVADDDDELRLPNKFEPNNYHATRFTYSWTWRK